MLYELLQYGLLSIVCIYLVSFQVKFWSVLTWVLNFGLALLVPEDVYQTLKTTPDPDIVEGIGMQYLVLYWSVYLLTWTIIPVLQEWQDAGDFSSGARLKRSLKSNGIFYLWMLVGAVVGLVVLVLLNAGGDMGLITFLKCLATIWGMLLLMGLMGYGLVEVPRTMWRNADSSTYLQYLHKRVAQTEQDVEQSIDEYKRITAYILLLKKSTKQELVHKYCEAAEEIVPPQLKKYQSNHYQNVLKTTGYLESYPFSLENAIEHKRLMRRAIARWRRQEKSLGDYVKQALFYADVQQAIEKETPLRSLVRKTGNKQELWYCKIRPIFNKIFALIVGLLAIILLISETQVFLSPHSSLLAYILRLDSLQAIRICVFVIMAFILYMANYALFRLKLANLYGLYPGESDGASLMFATVNFSRIGVAIVLNFFDMIKMETSIYAGVMQAPAMGLLGQWVIKGLPGVLWLIVLCHYFNFWGWMADKLGFDDRLAFASHQMTENAGHRMIPNRVQQKRKQLEQDHSKAILQFQELEKL